MKNLETAAQLQARKALSDVAFPRTGRVTSFDPSRYAVKVTIEPEGTATGFIPLAAVWVGNGWGIYAPPNIGDQVSVTYEDGNWMAAHADARFFNSESVPLQVQSGELWIVHAKGGFFKLTNDGKVTFSDGQGASVALNGDGTITSAANSWSHTGNVTITGDLNVSETITATTDVVGGNVSLANHLTNGVTAGTALSGLPVPL